VLIATSLQQRSFVRYERTSRMAQCAELQKHELNIYDFKCNTYLHSCFFYVLLSDQTAIWILIYNLSSYTRLQC